MSLSYPKTKTPHLPIAVCFLRLNLSSNSFASIEKRSTVEEDAL